MQPKIPPRRKATMTWQQNKLPKTSPQRESPPNLNAINPTPGAQENASELHAMQFGRRIEDRVESYDKAKSCP
jgi:hypothetical protein